MDRPMYGKAGPAYWDAMADKAQRNEELRAAVADVTHRAERAAQAVRQKLANTVTSPQHYKKGNGLEVWEVIEAWQATWPAGIRYHLGSALKYLGRLGAKEGASPDDDLEKAITFLTRALMLRKGVKEVDNG